MIFKKIEKTQLVSESLVLLWVGLSLVMLELSFSSNLVWNFYIICIAKSISKNSDSWFIVLSFFLLMLIYLYKSNIPHYMECCCYIWFGVPNCYLDMLNKSWKWVIRVAGPTLAASLNLLAHRQRWSVWVCIIDNY